MTAFKEHVAKAKGGARFISLQHDNHANTIDAMPHILDIVLGAKLKPVTVDKCLRLNE